MTFVYIPEYSLSNFSWSHGNSYSSDKLLLEHVVQDINDQKLKSVRFYIDHLDRPKSGTMALLGKIVATTPTLSEIRIHDYDGTFANASEYLHAIQNTPIKGFSYNIKEFDLNDMAPFVQELDHIKHLELTGKINDNFVSLFEVKNTALVSLRIENSFIEQFSPWGFNKLLDQIANSKITEFKVTSPLNVDCIDKADFKKTKITSLTLEHCENGALEKLHLKSTKINELKLPRNNLNVDVIEKLNVSLKESSVQKLSLSDNQLEAKELAALKLQSTKVVELNLNDCYLSKGHLLALDLKGTKVKTLHLDGNNLKSDAIDTLMKVAKGTALTHITFDSFDLNISTKQLTEVKHETHGDVLKISDVISFDNAAALPSGNGTPHLVYALANPVEQHVSTQQPLHHEIT